MKKSKIISDFYNNELPREPDKREHLGWEDRESQFKRFEVLTDYIDLTGKKLLDVGCGLGHLVEHLKARDIQVEYTGIDLLTSMVEEAQNRHGEQAFVQGDLFQQDILGDETFHVIYCSGVFNLNAGNNFDFLLEAVDKFLTLSTETIAFNLLHRDSPARDNKFYYFYPDQVIREVEQLSPRIKSIQLVEHYLNNDFTLFLSLQDGPLCRKDN